MTDFEREDMELQAMMGDKFIDETVEPAQKPVAKPIPVVQSEPVKKVHPMDIPVESQWQPEKPKPNFIEKLMQTAKDVCLYAVISSVVFWWQQSGKLDETTAWYALLISVGMAFFAVGKNWRGWCK